jgi:hypothetical protein
MENLLKIVGAIKKFLAKEFLWGLTILLLSFIMTLITKWTFIAMYNEYRTRDGDNTLDFSIDGVENTLFVNKVGDISINNDIYLTETEYFLILFAFYVLFIYSIRLVVNAIKTVKKK